MELTATKYKQTEVGLIPEDWEVEEFGDVADKRIKNSITGGPFGSNLKTDDYTSDGIQIIQLQNIGDGKFIDESVVYTSISKADELKSCNIYAGEIILSKMGDPVARACIMPFKAKRYLMASDGIRFVVDENRYDKKFVFNYINSKYFRNRAIDVSTGSTRQRIGLPDLKGLKFIKPPLTEQKAIATALSDVDDLIANLDKLITKKKAIKQGAMQQLLTPPHTCTEQGRSKGGKRLAGFTGEWVEKKLGEICKINMGQSPLSSNYNSSGNGLPLVQGNADIKKRKTIIRSYTSQITKTADDGDIIMSVRAPVGEVAIATFNCCIGRGVCSIKFPNNFLYHYLIYLESSWGKFSTGSTFDSINSYQLKGLELTIPLDPNEQKAIAQILSDMDVELEQLETKKSKYQDIKQGMMQELLTGKTRLV